MSRPHALPVRCCACGAALPEGRRWAYCTACGRAYRKAYYHAHPEEERARRREWNRAHPEVIAKAGRDYRARRKARRDGEQSQ